MDLMQKENLENSSVPSRKKANVGLSNVKKLSNFIKPLSDVKNIIEDKFNNLTQQGKISQTENASLAEDLHHEELFFYSENEDYYDDIIPKSLQLSESDVSQLVTVFDGLPTKNFKDESMESLIMPESFDIFQEYYDTEYLCDAIKGLDSSSLLFVDIDIKV